MTAVGISIGLRGTCHVVTLGDNFCIRCVLCTYLIYVEVGRYSNVKQSSNLSSYRENGEKLPGQEINQKIKRKKQF